MLTPQVKVITGDSTLWWSLGFGVDKTTSNPAYFQWGSNLGVQNFVLFYPQPANRCCLLCKWRTWVLFVSGSFLVNSKCDLFNSQTLYGIYNGCFYCLKADGD